MPVTLTFTTPLSTEDKAILASVAAAEGASAPVTSTGTTAPAAPINNFPTLASGAPDIENATVPSPENATIVILGGKVTGAPYLVDSNVSVWTLTMNPAGLGVAYVGSTQVGGGGAAQGIEQLLVRQGLVYCILQNGGQVQLWNPSEGSLYNATLPPASVATGTGTVTPPALPTLPALPPTPAIMGGSSGKIINCGSGQTLATITAGINAAAAGDKVQVAAGTYNETLPELSVPILLDLGGATLSGTGLTASLAGGGLGLIVPNAPGCIVQNGTITSVAMDQASAQMTAAVRPNGGCSYLETNNLTCTGNQTGFACGGFPIVWIDTGSILHNNGLGDAGGDTHNAYFSTGNVSAGGCQVTLNQTTSIIDPTATGPQGPLQGHAIKCRQEHGIIVNGGTFAAPSATIFDISDGSTTPVQLNGSTLNKTATDSNHGIIGYGMEATTNGLAGIVMNQGTVNALCASPLWQGSGGTLTLTDVTLNGNSIAAAGIAVMGS
jgi:hypothetical protein